MVSLPLGLCLGLLVDSPCYTTVPWSVQNASCHACCDSTPACVAETSNSFVFLSLSAQETDEEVVDFVNTVRMRVILNIMSLFRCIDRDEYKKSHVLL